MGLFSLIISLISLIISLFVFISGFISFRFLFALILGFSLVGWAAQFFGHLSTFTRLFLFSLCFRHFFEKPVYVRGKKVPIVRMSSFGAAFN